MADITSKITLRAEGGDQAAREVEKIHEAMQRVADASAEMQKQAMGGTAFDTAMRNTQPPPLPPPPPPQQPLPPQPAQQPSQIPQQPGFQSGQFLSTAAQAVASGAGSLGGRRSNLLGLAASAPALAPMVGALGGPVGIAVGAGVAALGIGMKVVNELAENEMQRVQETFVSGVAQRMGVVGEELRKTIIDEERRGTPASMVQSFLATYSRSGGDFGTLENLYLTAQGPGRTNMTDQTILNQVSDLMTGLGVSGDMLGRLTGRVSGAGMDPSRLFSEVNTMIGVQAFGESRASEFYENILRVLEKQLDANVDIGQHTIDSIIGLQATMEAGGMSANAINKTLETVTSNMSGRLDSPTQISKFLALRRPGESPFETQMRMETAQGQEDYVEELVRRNPGNLENAARRLAVEYPQMTLSQAYGLAQGVQRRIDIENMTPGEREAMLIRRNIDRTELDFNDPIAVSARVAGFDASSAQGSLAAIYGRQYGDVRTMAGDQQNVMRGLEQLALQVRTGINMGAGNFLGFDNDRIMAGTMDDATRRNMASRLDDYVTALQSIGSPHQAAQVLKQFESEFGVSLSGGGAVAMEDGTFYDPELGIYQTEDPQQARRRRRGGGGSPPPPSAAWGTGVPGMAMNPSLGLAMRSRQAAQTVQEAQPEVDVRTQLSTNLESAANVQAELATVMAESAVLEGQVASNLDSVAQMQTQINEQLNTAAQTLQEGITVSVQASAETLTNAVDQLRANLPTEIDVPIKYNVLTEPIQLNPEVSVESPEAINVNPAVNAPSEMVVPLTIRYDVTETPVELQPQIEAPTTPAIDLTPQVNAPSKMVVPLEIEYSVTENPVELNPEIQTIPTQSIELDPQVNAPSVMRVPLEIQYDVTENPVELNPQLSVESPEAVNLTPQVNAPTEMDLPLHVKYNVVEEPVELAPQIPTIEPQLIDMPITMRPVVTVAPLVMEDAATPTTATSTTATPSLAGAPARAKGAPFTASGGSFIPDPASVDISYATPATPKLDLGVSSLSTTAGFISQFEGLSLEPYHDPAGYPTIGYGQKLSDEKWADLSQWENITQGQAHAMLTNEVGWRYQRVKELFPEIENPQQLAALTSLGYNIGMGALEDSKLRELIRTGAPMGVIVSEWNTWNKAGGKTLTGLVNRRSAEANMFMQTGPFKFVGGFSGAPSGGGGSGGGLGVPGMPNLGGGPGSDARRRQIATNVSGAMRGFFSSLGNMPGMFPSGTGGAEAIAEMAGVSVSDLRTGAGVPGNALQQFANLSNRVDQAVWGAISPYIDAIGGLPQVSGRDSEARLELSYLMGTGRRELTESDHRRNAEANQKVQEMVYEKMDEAVRWLAQVVTNLTAIKLSGQEVADNTYAGVPTDE